MASERIQRRIERLLDQIEEAADQGDWELARTLAEEVLGFAPDNSDAIAFIEVANQRILSGKTPESELPDSLLATTQSSDTPPQQPPSFANGRYEVKRFLGEGGKKKVYLAHDTLLDRDVAFALIKTEGLDDVARHRITREAQAMGRLGSHPHIVTVFDLGSHNNQPFMVTELMGGGDVEGAIEKAPEHRLPLERAVQIVIETCRGLEFAHQRGIVHRDLKPGNVWLTSEGTAKIGDFGLAVALDRSRLTAEGLMVGTVSYMPPEQALGGAVTPQSDLYSLGAMLYEMVTGRPPFLGDDPVAIIGQHINTPPVAPTWHNPDCPRPLEAMVLRLLSKDPKERPASAADVRQALEAIDLAEVSPTGPMLDEAHALDSLAGGVFVGRQREMGELKAALEDVLSGRGKMVTLVGEPGIGKTRTALELATYAGLRQCQVLWGRSYEGTGAPPYWPWVQAIRSYVREHEASQVQQEMGSGAVDIAEIVSEVKERFPKLKPPPQLEPEQARFRLFDSITSFLKSASRHQPLVLVLEDLHWADRPSLLLLEFLARELAGSRLLVTGTYRDVEVNRRHPLSQTLGELTRERLFQRVLLRGLSQEDVGRFIELVSGLTPPRGLVESVYRQTEGNPLFVTEVVRLLVQEGELSRERTGQRDSWTVRIPEGVREAIGRRLDRLSERCNQTLTTAAVIGREFSLEQLKPLVEDMTEDRLLEVLEEALSTRIIEELPRAVGRYQFTHALIQETLLEELSLTRRVRLHARIAQELEKLYGANAEAHAAELAHHFGQAEAVLGPEKVLRYSLLAGEKALSAYGWEEALAYFQRGLTVKGVSSEGTEPAQDAESAALLFGLVRAQVPTMTSRVSRPQAAVVVATLTRAFDYYEGSGDIDQAVAVAEYRLIATAVESPAGARLIDRALALVPPDSHAAGRLLSQRIRILGVYEGNYPAAREAAQRALAIARREQDEALELWTLANWGALEQQHAHYQEAVPRCEQALTLALHLDDPRSELLARHGWHISRQIMGEGPTEAARQNAAAQQSKAVRLRDNYWLSEAQWVDATIAYQEGDWEAARQHLDRALAVSPSDPRWLSLRIALEYQAGESGQEEKYLERLLEVMGRTPALSLQTTLQTSVMAPLGVALAGYLSGDASHLAEAEALAKSVLSSPQAPLHHVIPPRTALGLMAVQQSDLAQCQEHYQALEPHRGITVVGSTLTLTDRVLGLLSHTLGNLDTAGAHFEDALAYLHKSGNRPELAWTCCDYADTLLARNHSGDRQKAMSLLDECLRITRELGMRPLMQRALSRRELLKA
jgi:tetratricopeptide (TPR) repeat protein